MFFVDFFTLMSKEINPDVFNSCFQIDRGVKGVPLKPLSACTKCFKTTATWMDTNFWASVENSRLSPWATLPHFSCTPYFMSAYTTRWSTPTDPYKETGSSNLLLSAAQWALYISGVRSSGHRVKPNMAVNGGTNLRRLSLPTRSFIFTCIVKIAQGDWNRRNLEPPCPPYLASLFARSGDRKISLHIYIYMELTGAAKLMTLNLKMAARSQEEPSL